MVLRGLLRVSEGCAAAPDYVSWNLYEILVRFTCNELMDPDSSRISSPSRSSDDLQEGSVSGDFFFMSRRWLCFLEILNLVRIVLDGDLQEVCQGPSIEFY